MSRNAITVLALSGLGLLGGCGGGDNTALTTIPTAHLAITLPAATVGAGAPFTFTVTALDAMNAVVPTYIGTVHIATSDASAKLPADATLARGVGQFTVTFNTTGNQTITASDTVGDATSGTSPTVSVIASACGGVLGGPQSVAVDPTGRFAYVTKADCTPPYAGHVFMYAIDTTNGTLTSIAPSVPSNDEGPISVAVDPAGKFAYVANWGEGDTAGSVSTYTINATTGALTSIATILAPCAPPPSPGSCAPFSVTVDPSGKFAYTANEGGFAPTSASMYVINTTGALTFLGTVPVVSGGRARSVTVDPKGTFVYLTATTDNPATSAGEVSTYTVNASTGALTLAGSIAAGVAPVSVTVDPAGRFVYVTNSDSNDVSMYTIDATTGSLTSIGTITAGTNPTSVAVDPASKFAYVINSGSDDVSLYSINATTGALTSVGTVATGVFPTSIAVDPSGRFAYVTNSGSNDVSMYSIDAATGALALIGTVGT